MGDLPGCSPLLTACIIPDHNGREDFNGREIFQRKSTFQEKSRTLIADSFWYFNPI